MSISSIECSLAIFFPNEKNNTSFSGESVQDDKQIGI